jgi:glycosyltransferase involved in cell wall biosynthesis
MALIDILMPARNAEPFLVEAVGSILAQSFTDWRLIAVDDQSSDGTWGMLCTFGKGDDRILPLKNEGTGIARALNTALIHSSAPFLARMDADDTSDPIRLERILELLNRNPHVGVAGSRVRVFPPDMVSPNMERYITWQNSLLTPQQMRRERYVESTLTHASAAFRREVLMETEGWREGLFPEDLDLWLRLHRTGVTFVKHPEVLYLWREHGQRETRNSQRCTPAAFHLCKRVHLSEELKDRDFSKLVVLGSQEARNRWTRDLEEKGFEVASLAWRPGEPIPTQAYKTDFILAAFGVPRVREKAREELNELGDEEDRWLFVG